MSTLGTLERTGPRRITDLALIQGITQPSMTVLVGRLERSGLVERHDDPADRRVALVALTRAGRADIQARRRLAADGLDRLIGQLGPADMAALREAVPALIHLRELADQEQEIAARGARA
jgi:DNA-binding MarR family transcriptional regulator